jgi:hypothetical protein
MRKYGVGAAGHRARPAPTLTADAPGQDIRLCGSNRAYGLAHAPTRAPHACTRAHTREGAGLPFGNPAPSTVATAARLSGAAWAQWWPWPLLSSLYSSEVGFGICACSP